MVAESWRQGGDVCRLVVLPQVLEEAILVGRRRHVDWLTPLLGHRSVIPVQNSPPWC